MVESVHTDNPLSRQEDGRDILRYHHDHSPPPPRSLVDPTSDTTIGTTLLVFVPGCACVHLAALPDADGARAAMPAEL